MEKNESKFDRDDTLIWVCLSLMVLIGVQMYFTLQFKETIKNQEVVIKKLQLTQKNTAEVDSLKTVIKNLEEFAAESDERCAIAMDQLQTKIVQYEYEKNNPKK